MKDSNQLYFIILGNGIGMAACCSLLYGAIKYNWIAVLIYLFATILSIGFNFINATLLFTLAEANGGSLVMALGVSIIIINLVSLCFWLCVFHFFKKLQDLSKLPDLLEEATRAI